MPSSLPVARTTRLTARGQRAVDRAGDLGVLHLDLALEDAARRDRQLGRVDHAGFHRAFDHQAFGILHGALHADAAADDQGAPFGRIREGVRAGGRPGRGPAAAGGTTCGPGAVVNGGRDMVCVSCGWAGRKGGTPRPVSTGLLGVPDMWLVGLPG